MNIIITAILASATLTAGAEEAPARPNVIVILADDLGFSDLGCYGGEVPTPNLDRLAKGGARFSAFYTSARCCPSRASLMTGLHPHQAGIGSFANARPERGAGPAYTGHLLPTCVTLAEVLGDAGYSTWMVGKWHMGTPGPIDRGFQDYFGYRNFLAYAADQWSPGEYARLPEGTPPELAIDGNEFYATDVFNRYALEFLDRAREREQPYFLYLAHSSPHFPVQAPKESIDRHVATYRQGWDVLRAARFGRQKALGLFPADAELPPRSMVPVDRDDIANGYPGRENPAWDALPADRREDLARRMATFAAMVEHVDAGVGKILEDLERHGELDDTLIFFLSDNGACYEWGPFGFDGPSRKGVTDLHAGAGLDRMGQAGTHHAYGSGWANLGNTPLNMYKHFCHEGGIASPLLVHWPSRLGRSGGWVHDPAHLMDVVPTVLEATGATYPKARDGHSVTPLEGTSLLPAIGGTPLPERSLAFEHQEARGLRRGPWKITRGKRQPTEPTWELYDLRDDRSERHDLAAEEPDLLDELAGEWDAWAKRVGSKPFPKPDDPDLSGSAEVPPADEGGKSPRIDNRPLEIRAKVKSPAPRGVVLAQGGREHGFALHFLEGRPAFDVRIDGKVTRLVAEDARGGEIALKATLDRRTMSLAVDGGEAISRPSPGLIPAQPADPLSVGFDDRTAAGDYEPPNPFRGEVLQAEVKPGSVDQARRDVGREGPSAAIEPVPSAYPGSSLQAVPFHEVAIIDPFWGGRIATTQEVTIPDLLDLAEEQGKIDNFRIVAGRKEGGRIALYNAPDSDVYKLIEAASYTFASRRDPGLERRIDDLIGVIAAAQQPDGYLNTQYTLPIDHPASPRPGNRHLKTFGYGPDDRWSSRAENWPHGYSQLYCAGHLFEAAAAHALATGRRELLGVARRLADHVDGVFDDRKLEGYADHPQVEIGLIKLYEVTGERRYLRLADRIARRSDFGRPPDIGSGRSRLPLAEQREAFGHCVRTSYVYGGATDLVRATGADDLAEAIGSLWESVAGHKMYVHGGVGNGTKAEQHGLDDDLPIDGLYSECCASIAQGQWNHRLNLLHGDARYADLIELESYNSALAGISLDGSKYFYTNLLNVGDLGRDDPHRGVRRRYLFCCPSKLPGFVAGIGRWIYAHDEDSLVVNLYIGSSTTVPLARGDVHCDLATGLPWDGSSTLTVRPETPGLDFELRLRLPGWLHRPGPVPTDLYGFSDGLAPAWRVEVNGRVVDAPLDRGYLLVRRRWDPGDRVELTFEMPVRRIHANSRVEDQQGYVALMRGPLIYALEGLDNPFDVLRAVLPPEAPISSEDRPGLLGGLTVLRGSCRSAGEEKEFVAIPYFAWQNRGISKLATMLIEDPGRVQWAAAPNDPGNLATLARASSSAGLEGGEHLSALQDGALPGRSADRETPRFSWPPNGGARDWVQYDFPRPQTFASVEVYWSDDHPGGSERAPKAWRLLWKQGDRWVPVSSRSGAEAGPDRLNVLRFDPVTTESLRIEVEPEPGSSAGLFEWRIPPYENTDG